MGLGRQPKRQKRHLAYETDSGQRFWLTRDITLAGALLELSGGAEFIITFFDGTDATDRYTERETGLSDKGVTFGGVYITELPDTILPRVLNLYDKDNASNSEIQRHVSVPVFARADWKRFEIGQELQLGGLVWRVVGKSPEYQLRGE